MKCCTLVKIFHAQAAGERHRCTVGLLSRCLEVVNEWTAHEVVHHIH